MVDTLFGGLLDHSFKGVSFPTTQFTVDLRHDLAIHKYVDKDGGEIEGTGRAPLQFSARIPFINGLEAGPREKWAAPLYPYQFRKFVTATADKATGVLNHPEFGPINVKTEGVHIVWDGNCQGGVYVDVTWIETVLNAADIDAFLGGTSPVSQIAQAAAYADSIYAANKYDIPTVPTLPKMAYTFGDLANTIRSVADAPSLLNQQVGGRIDAIVAQANTVQAALDTVSNPMNWLLAQTMQRILQAGYGLRQTILAKKRAIGLYPVQKEATMASLASTIPANLSDLFILNPTLLRSPVVPQGATVRYYAVAAAA